MLIILFLFLLFLRGQKLALFYRTKLTDFLIRLCLKILNFPKDLGILVRLDWNQNS